MDIVGLEAQMNVKKIDMVAIRKELTHLRERQRRLRKERVELEDVFVEMRAEREQDERDADVEYSTARKHLSSIENITRSVENVHDKSVDAISAVRARMSGIQNAYRRVLERLRQVETTRETSMKRLAREEVMFKSKMEIVERDIESLLRERQRLQDATQAHVAAVQKTSIEVSALKEQCTSLEADMSNTRAVSAEARRAYQDEIRESETARETERREVASLATESVALEKSLLTLEDRRSMMIRRRGEVDAIEVEIKANVQNKDVERFREECSVRVDRFRDECEEEIRRVGAERQRHMTVELKDLEEEVESMTREVHQTTAKINNA